MGGSASDPGVFKHSSSHPATGILCTPRSAICVLGDLHDSFSGDLFRLHGVHTPGEARRRSSQKEQTPSPTFVHTAWQTSEDLWNRESGIASSGSDKVISVAGSAYAKYTEYEMYEIPIPRVIRLSCPDGRAPASAPQGGDGGLGPGSGERCLRTTFFTRRTVARGGARQVPNCGIGDLLAATWRSTRRGRTTSKIDRDRAHSMVQCSRRDAATPGRTTTLSTLG